MPDDRAPAAYAERAAEYIDLLGCIDATAEPDRELIGTWAAGVNGRILDVGCGPGHWTAWLHAQGRDIAGVDPVTSFVEHARASHPGVRFDRGYAERLSVEDSSVGGILAWYSLIHTDPERVPAVLREFARALTPGGSLVLGFFDGPDLEPFEHAVTTAYCWPVETLARLVEDAGLIVDETDRRKDAGSRAHGAIVAHRPHLLH